MAVKRTQVGRHLGTVKRQVSGRSTTVFILIW